MNLESNDQRPDTYIYAMLYTLNPYWFKNCDVSIGNLVEQNYYLE